MIFALLNLTAPSNIIKSFNRFAWDPTTHQQMQSYLLRDGQHPLVVKKKSLNCLMKRLCLLVKVTFVISNILDECTKINSVQSKINKIIAILILVAR